MARPTDREIVEMETRRLVRQITKISDADEGGVSHTSNPVDHLTYERRVECALNTFRYRHRFLDVNRHSVWRSINGLCRKLLVHSQEERSTELKLLCERFVRSEVFRRGAGVVVGIGWGERRKGLLGDQSTTVDVEYSLLSLVVHLADRPTAIMGMTSKHHVDRQHSNVPEIDQKNDIRKCVLADLLAQRDVQEKSEASSSDDLSDWSDAEDIQSSNRGNEVDLTDQRAHRLRLLRPDVSDYRLGLYRKPSENGAGSNESRAWLSRNLTPPYWADSLGFFQSCQSHSTFSQAANLRSQWEACIDSRCVLRTINEAVELTERQIIRETIWLLQGRQQLFAFEHSNGAWIVRDGVAVSHLTQRSLFRLLDSFASCGNILATLRCFIEQTMNSQHKSMPIAVCRTYEAYASALSSSLIEFEQLLCKLERTCAEQNLTLTLLTLSDRLRSWFALLSAVERIHMSAVVSCPMEATACEMAVRMQTELYSALVYAASEGEGSFISRRTDVFLLSLFVETVRPYLEMIDCWVTLGNIRDYHSEFLLARNEEVAMSDDTFWKNAVVVRSRGPLFLCSTLDDLIITGKSTQLLRRLDRLGAGNWKAKEREAASITASQCRPLHELFVERLQQALCQLPPEFGGTDEMLRKEVQSLRHSTDVSGPLWKRILASNFGGRSACALTNCSSSFIGNEETDVDPSFRGGRHIGDVICECLNTLIRSRCSINCAKLIDILDEEFGLGDHLISIRKFYLMEAGDIMFHFYSQLFDKVSANKILTEEVQMKMILDDVLTCYAVPEANRLSVELDRDAAGASNTDFVHLYNGIKLSYKVPWPLDLVISPAMWRKYDRIFSFLLRIKCTKYALDELRFADLNGMTDLKTVSGLYLTRTKLLHFVNGFHGFLMTRLLYDDCKKDSTVKTRRLAQNLQDVMDDQRELLERIEERCLLHPRMSAVLDAVTSVFNSALDFHAFWKGTSVDDGEKILANVDGNLRNCGPFLIAVLRKSASSTQLLPHLESLVSMLCAGDAFDCDYSNDAIAGKRF